MKKFFVKLFAENPVFVLLLGTCPTMGVSTSVLNGLGMGLTATMVLILTNTVISVLRNFIPPKIRIASYVVLIAGIVTVVEMCLAAFFPEIAQSLGVFIPLMAVNCIIFARAESYASKHGPVKSALDGLNMGVGFTIALVILSTARELLGNGSVLGFQILGDYYKPAMMMILPPGGFIMLGIIIGVMNSIAKKRGVQNG